MTGLLEEMKIEKKVYEQWKTQLVPNSSLNLEKLTEVMSTFSASSNNFTKAKFINLNILAAETEHLCSEQPTRFKDLPSDNVYYLTRKREREVKFDEQLVQIKQVNRKLPEKRADSSLELQALRSFSIDLDLVREKSNMSYALELSHKSSLVSV